ncbi:hypothetical protein GQ42DRAFT_165687, partial [Ramicandelaber brevisporus]
NFDELALNDVSVKRGNSLTATCSYPSCIANSALAHSSSVTNHQLLYFYVQRWATEHHRAVDEFYSNVWQAISAKSDHEDDAEKILARMKKHLKLGNSHQELAVVFVDLFEGELPTSDDQVADVIRQLVSKQNKELEQLKADVKKTYSVNVDVKLVKFED